MRAVIIATGYHNELAPLIYYRPSALLQILDKPIIVYIVEFLQRCGIVNIDIILHHLPTKIEECLQRGERWGVKISYHLATDLKRPFAPFRTQAALLGDEPLLVGLGDALPSFNFYILKGLFQQKALLLCYFKKEWSGWGILPASLWDKLPIDTHEKNLLDTLSPFGYQTMTVQPLLLATHFNELYKSNEKAMQMQQQASSLKNDDKNSLLISSSAKRIGAAMWISRGTTIHPTVCLHPPLFIGEECTIERECCIGPHAVIESHCVISKGSTVKETLICHHSYIGEGLEAIHRIIDRNILIDLRRQAKIPMIDHLILSELKKTSLTQSSFFFIERTLALLLLCLFSPLLALLLLGKKLQWKEVVVLPTYQEKVYWTTCRWLVGSSGHCSPLLKGLLLLANIVKGYAHFVGVAPRTIEEVEALPPDWRMLYLQSKIGLITLAEAEEINSSSPDDLYSAEAFYIVQQQWWYDFKVLFLWLKKKTWIRWK